jgi:hypothetical protein
VLARRLSQPQLAHIARQAWAKNNVKAASASPTPMVQTWNILAASASAQLFGGGSGAVYNVNWDNYSSTIGRCVGYITNSCKPQPAKPIKQVRKPKR